MYITRLEWIKKLHGFVQLIFLILPVLLCGTSLKVICIFSCNLWMLLVVLGTLRLWLCTYSNQSWIFGWWHIIALFSIMMPELCELSMLLTKDQMFKGYLCSHSKPTTLVNNIIGRIILLPEIMPSSNYRCVDTKLQHHAAW